MVCPHEQGGLIQCGHFADKGVNFWQFSADDFYGRFLRLFQNDITSFKSKKVSF